MRAVFLAHLAERFQCAMNREQHRIDARMRQRAWEWWSEAQRLGLVLQ